MNLSDINKTLEQAFGNQSGGTRKPLIAYALDPDFITKDHWDELGNLNFERIHQRYPFLALVYWANLFYETGDGNNYRGVLKRGCSNTENDEYKPAYYNELENRCNLPKLGKPSFSFPVECWLLSGQEHGTTSTLYRGLIDLCSALASCIDDESAWEELEEFSQNNHKLHAAHRYLIEKRNSFFLDSLRTIADSVTIDENEAPGDDRAWLDTLRSSSLQARIQATSSATANWKLYVNGNRIELVLSIENIRFRGNDHQQLCLSNIALKRALNVPISWIDSENNSILIPVHRLEESGIKLDCPVEMRVGSRTIEIEPLPESDQLIFRCGNRSKAFAFIKVPGQPDFNDHIYARSLYIAESVSVGTNLRYKIGEDNLNAIRCGTIPWIGEKRRSVIRLDFNDIRLDPPQELNTYQGITEHPIDQDASVSLLLVGCKPWIGCREASEATWPESPDTVVVTGNSCELNLHNYYGDRFETGEWTHSAGTLSDEQNHDGILQITLNCQPFQLVRVAHSASKAKIKILFLPADFGDVLPNPEIEKQGSNWNWTPEQDLFQLANAANHDELPGNLYSENQSFPLRLPLKHPTWWFKNAQDESVSSFRSMKEFNSFSDAAPWFFHYTIPDCEEGISLSWEHDAATPRTVKATGSLPIRELLHQLPLDGDLSAGIVDTLFFGATPVLQVLREPDTVALFQSADDEALKVFIPEGYQNVQNYRVVVCSEACLAGNGDFCLTDLNALQDGHTPSNFDCKRERWAFLLSSDTPQLIDLITDFSIFLRIGARCIAIQQRLQLNRADVDLALIDRVADHGFTSLQKQTLQANLDLLANSEIPEIQGVFNQALSEREHLVFGCPAEYWRHQPAELFRVEDEQLKTTLKSMLQTGFNWCAEPGLFKNLEDRVKKSYSDHNPRQNFTASRKAALTSLFPPIPAQQLIEQGFPLGLANNASCPGLTTPSYQDLGNAFLRIALPESDLPGFNSPAIFRGVRPNGTVLGAPTGPQLKTYFSYHDNVTIRDNMGKYCRPSLVIAERDRVQCQKYFTDDPARAKGINHDLINDSDKQRLSKLFHDSLNCAAFVIGTGENPCGLKVFFLLSDEGFGTNSEDLGQGNSQLIFRAAVLCRLHAWYGLDNSYTPDWPLTEPSNYRFLSRVVLRVFENDTARHIFAHDLVPVEWYLAWFHE